MDVVIDNSVAMRWELPGVPEEQHLYEYSHKVLAELEAISAGVPWLWHAEASNVLIRAERAGIRTQAQVDGFLARLAGLQLQTQADPLNLFAGEALALLRRNRKLSGYDAVYLALARRAGVPLATNDADLADAATSEGVELFLGGPAWAKAKARKPSKKLK